MINGTAYSYVWCKCAGLGVPVLRDVPESLQGWLMEAKEPSHDSKRDCGACSDTIEQLNYHAGSCLTLWLGLLGPPSTIVLSAVARLLAIDLASNPMLSAIRHIMLVLHHEVILLSSYRHIMSDSTQSNSIHGFDFAPFSCVPASWKCIHMDCGTNIATSSAVSSGTQSTYSVRPRQSKAIPSSKQYFVLRYILACTLSILAS